MVPPKSSTKIMCFVEKHQALKFKKYLATYRSKYGEWPNMNMNTEYEKIEAKEPEPLYSIFTNITIETIDETNLLREIDNQNIGILLCYEFNIKNNLDTFTLDLKGKEVEIEQDSENFVRNLESVFFKE
jgi:hypothetical protein